LPSAGWDVAGSSFVPFTVNGGTIADAEVSETVVDGGTELTLTFTPGSFMAGDELRFEIDVDTIFEFGDGFGDEQVPFTVKFSDGTVLNGEYESGPNDTSVAAVEAEYGSTLLGEGGDDYIVGSDDNDLMDGGSGANVLTGNGGADIFRLTATDVLLDETLADMVLDYDGAVEGDQVDVTSLLEDLYGAGNDGTIANVQVVESGSDVLVQIDLAAGGAEDWSTVAVLAGYATPGSDPVQILIDAAQTTLNA
jgi:Ca2+-binding RTX toxin-like protein